MDLVLQLLRMLVAFMHFQSLPCCRHQQRTNNKRRQNTNPMSRKKLLAAMGNAGLTRFYWAIFQKTSDIGIQLGGGLISARRIALHGTKHNGVKISFELLA